MLTTTVSASPQKDWPEEHYATSKKPSSMKYVAHIPTEQYGYLGFEDFTGTREEAWNEYRAIRETVKPQPKGMPDAEFRALYDKVATKQPIQDDPGILERMNPLQKYAINQAKLFVKRQSK